MSEQTIRLIQLLKEGKTCNEICSILHISNKQLFNNLTNLRNKGLFYKRNYYSNGVISYKPISSIKELKSYMVGQDRSIITSHSETTLPCLVISDLHFGSELERLDLLDKAYNYCIERGIHIILCCGDMLDGTFNQNPQKIENIYMQIEHFIKHYPFDKNIITFGVGGNHDMSALYNGCQDIIEVTKNYRHDIVIGGYNNSCIYIKNDKILLYHHTNQGEMRETDAPIILHGHLHKYSTQMLDNVLNITVPSLSDMNDSFPTALELTLQFKKGFISIATMRQIYFDSKPCVLNEVSYNLLKNREVVIAGIKYEQQSERIEGLFIEEPTMLESQKIDGVEQPKTLLLQKN